MASDSPTQRSLAHVRRQGGIANVVERYNYYSRKRQDLFRGIDIVAILDGEIWGIQSTSGTNHAKRVRDALDNPLLALWVDAGGRFEVWSWSQRVARNKDGSKAKVKRWTLRRAALVLAAGKITVKAVE